MTSGNHPNYCIIEIGQNTEKSPGDLKTLLSLNFSESLSAYADVKNSQEVNNNNNDNVFIEQCVNIVEHRNLKNGINTNQNQLQKPKKQLFF